MLKRLSISFLLLWTMACDRDKRPVLNGRVEAYLSDLGFRVGGRLVELKVVEGQRVKRGDLLARVAAEELDAAVERDAAGMEAAEARRLELAHGTRAEQIAQGEARLRDAEAALRLAEASFRRAQWLLRDGVSSQAEMDRAQMERDRAREALNLQSKSLAELKAGAREEQRLNVGAEAKRARALLEQSRVQVGFTEIRVPFDGVIIHRLRELGSVLSPGQAVLTIARLDRLWVRVYLPQSIQSKATLGMDVTVITPDKRALKAQLNEVASEAEYTPKMVETQEERVNLVYAARVHIPQGWDEGLLPGMAVVVKLGSPPSQVAAQ